MDPSTRNVAASLVRMNSVLFDDGDFFYHQGKRVARAIENGRVGSHFRAIRERCGGSSTDSRGADKEGHVKEAYKPKSLVLDTLVRVKEKVKASHVVANESLKGGAVAKRKREISREPRKKGALGEAEATKKEDAGVSPQV